MSGMQFYKQNLKHANAWETILYSSWIIFYFKCEMSKILSLCQICYESINEVFQVVFRFNMVYIKFYQKRDFLSQYNDNVFDYFLCFCLRH